MATPKVAVNLTVTVELYDAIKQAAAARNVGVATFVRDLITRELSYLTKQERGRRRPVDPWEIDDAELRGATAAVS